MKEKIKIHSLNKKDLTCIINEESEVNSTYDCFEFERTMNMLHPYLSTLTDEQRNQIESIRENMIKHNFSPQKIRKIIIYKLQKFNIHVPIKDEILDSKIERNIQRLQFLKQEKELREIGYSWEDINDLILDEYEQDLFEEKQIGFTYIPLFYKNEYITQFHKDRKNEILTDT